MIRMPNFYCPPLETPLYWRDEQSGELPAAVNAYFNSIMGTGEISESQLKLLVEYCNYFINAPCWKNNLLECEEMLEELNGLIARAKTLASTESIRRWNDECMELALDPF